MTDDQLTSDLESLRLPRDEPERDRGAGASSRPKRADRGRIPVGTVVALALVGALGYAGVRAYPSVQARVFKTEVQTAEIAVLSPVQATTQLTAAGYVVPRTSSRVASRVIGRVARARAREGELVRAGQVLLELDAADNQTAIAAARARALAAQARVATARANHLEARLQADRQRALVERGVAPRATLEDLDARARSLAAAVAAAVAEARAADAEVAVQRVARGQLTITAPIAGTILTRVPEVGEMLTPEVPALEIADMDSLVVEVDVPEARLHLVRVGGPCEVVLEAFPGRRFRGAALEIGRRIDRAKAAVPVKVRFVDPAREALPNMSGRVSFLSEELSPEALRARERVVVPAAAVAERNGGRVVFVVDEGVVHPRPVRTGARVGDDLELVEGPPPRTRVVLHPPASLADGNRIRENRP